MIAFFQGIVGVLVPIFVVSTMLNVGLTQRPDEIVKYLRHWRFILRMLIANFVLGKPLTTSRVLALRMIAKDLFDNAIGDC